MAGPERDVASNDRAGPDLARNILPSSGTMIGICTTLVGLVKIAEGRLGPSRADEFGGLVGIVFLFSAILSYLAIRTTRRLRMSRRFERAADMLFMIGLICIVAVAVLFAFERI